MQEDGIAQFFLGQMYYNGEGVEQDYNKKAVNWFRKAVDKGSKDTESIMGKK